MSKDLTEIIFLLDRSGSMSGLEADTIGGFNTFIEKQSKLEGKTMLTTVLFDNECEVLWDGMDAVQEAGNIGISMEQVHNFEASTDGVEVMYDKINELVKNYRQE